jgi:hypothetical protein
MLRAKLLRNYWRHAMVLVDIHRIGNDWISDKLVSYAMNRKQLALQLDVKVSQPNAMPHRATYLICLPLVEGTPFLLHVSMAFFAIGTRIYSPEAQRVPGD